MQVNVGPVERVVRLVIGLALVAAGLLWIRGVLGVMVALVGGVLIFSGAIGFCHVRKFFGICRVTKKP